MSRVVSEFSTNELGYGVVQASVNPKAETVEELQRRRKGLHLGMCKLLREDLSIMAEQRATVNDQQVRITLNIGQTKFAIRNSLQVANSMLIKLSHAIYFVNLTNFNVCLVYINYLI